MIWFFVLMFVCGALSGFALGLAYIGERYELRQLGKPKRPSLVLIYGENGGAIIVPVRFLGELNLIPRVIGGYTSNTTIETPETNVMELLPNGRVANSSLLRWKAIEYAADKEVAEAKGLLVP